MTAVVFYFLAMVIIIFSVAVILLPNPIYSALSLAVTMVALGFMYYLLNAPFMAGVQLIVYAGAVMVMFVMVLMLIDLKSDEGSIVGNTIGTMFKFSAAALFVMIIAWSVASSIAVTEVNMVLMSPGEQVSSVKALAKMLFTKYVFAFEILGVLLLLIAVGVVAVSRTKGGTHARD